MDNHTVCENAYHNGFEAGIKSMQENKVFQWMLVDRDNGTCVCPVCNRQDHIDTLAKYCRYCGARVEFDKTDWLECGTKLWNEEK